MRRWRRPRMPGWSSRSGRRDGADRAHRADRVRQVDGRALAGGAARRASSSTPIGSRVTCCDLGSRPSTRSSRGSAAGLLRDDGSLDRAALGRIVFADAGGAPRPRGDRPSRRPAADPGRDRRRRGRGGATAVVIEAIKLVEGGLAEACDEVWLVTCDPAVQRARLVGRGSTRRTRRARCARPDSRTRRPGPRPDTSDRRRRGDGRRPSPGRRGSDACRRRPTPRAESAARVASTGRGAGASRPARLLRPPTREHHARARPEHPFGSCVDW